MIFYVYIIILLWLGAPDPTNKCACLGDTLTYTCTILGVAGGATVWIGNAFVSCAAKEITLLHPRFIDGTIRTACSDIVAETLSVEGNHYTSRFNITLISERVGKTVVCLYHDMTTGGGQLIQFSSKISGCYQEYIVIKREGRVSHLCIWL